MGYIGLRTDTSGTYRTLDDISGSFDNSTTSFGLAFNGNALEVTDPRQLIISIDGVIQEPESAFNTAGTNIIFSEPPHEGSTFWGNLLGGTYDVLNPELSDATLIDVNYDNTFGPLDGLATMTANTTSYADSSTNVATTNFVRHHSVPMFKYVYDGSTINISNDDSEVITFDSGDLTQSNAISGFTMTSGELTFPATYQGAWQISAVAKSGAVGGAIEVLTTVNIEIWNGATWIEAALTEIHQSALTAGQSMTASSIGVLTTDGTANKIRIRVYQTNSATSSIGFPDCELTGIYLGRDT